MKQARASFKAPTGVRGQCGLSAARSNLFRLGLLLAVAMTMSLAPIGKLRAQQQSGLLPAACKKEYQNLIFIASAKHDFTQMLRLLKQYRGAQCPFFADLDYYEAFAAFNTGDHERAKTAVERYMRAPGEKQYAQQAEAMHLQIRKEEEQKTQGELHIQWNTGSLSKATILGGQAKLAGRILDIKGLTLRCDLWNTHNYTYAEREAVYGGSAPHHDLREDQDVTFEKGVYIATHFFHRETMQFTLHFLDSADPDPGDTYHRAPWDAYYQWSGSGTGSWQKYDKHDNASLALWDMDWDVGHMTVVVFSTNAESNIYWGDELHITLTFVVDSSTWRVVQTVAPHFSGDAAEYCKSTQVAISGCRELLRGFNSVIGSHPEECHLIPYRKPPDPE